MNTIFENLKKQSLILKKDLISFILKLIKIPSPALNEELCAKLIKETMTQYGYDKVFIDSFGNVIGIISGREDKDTVLLTSHMDIHPFPDDKDKIERLLDVQLRENKIFGSSRLDSKYCLATQIFSGILIKNSGIKLNRNIIVAATVANENGLGLGLRGFLENTAKEVGLDPSFALIGEPTNLELKNSHDGWALINIQLSGPTIAEVGEAALKVINSLEDIYSTGSHSAEGKLLSTQNVKLDSHKNRASANIFLLRRLLPNQSMEKVLRNIRDNIALYLMPFPKVSLGIGVLKNRRTLYNGLSLEVSNQSSAWITNPSNELYESIINALKSVEIEYRSGEMILNPIGIGSAGSILVNEYKIPSYEFGPMSTVLYGDQSEHMDINKLLKGVFGNAVIAWSVINNSNKQLYSSGDIK